MLTFDADSSVDPDTRVDVIRVRGARTHNLQGIDVDIPLGQFTVISGVSGSGKSSLAFETIHTESLHRYLATVSTQTRELLQRRDRPPVDLIDGLPPTLAIEQRSRGPRRRTTLATITDLYDYLRLLYSRIGILHCPECGKPVTSQSRESIVDQILQLQDRSKALILAPVVRNQAGNHTELLARCARDGFVRARVDGELFDLASPPPLEARKPHQIEVVIDRLIIKEGIRNRVEESVDLALQVGQGQCIVSREVNGEWLDRFYSSRLACAACGLSFPSMEPGDFSFNSPRGACPTCHGLGTLNDAESQASSRCADCHGQRLALLPRSVLIQGASLGELMDMTASRLQAVMNQWRDNLPEQIAAETLPEIVSRLSVLIELGLDYLALGRAGETLSSGEYQRARLTSSLGNQLTGVCYVIDEPTSGLHPSDTRRLMTSLRRLQQQGNTLIVVEHDLDVIRRSDLVIEIGPGAGTQGGKLVAASPPGDLVTRLDSPTGCELARRRSGLPKDRPPFIPDQFLILEKATLHNLRQVSVKFPLRGLVCMTGVSGSGKSSLVMQTLVPALQRQWGRPASPGPFQELRGADQIARLVQVDQKPLGRSERSTPATYSGLWDEVRQVFAKTKEARVRGFTPRRFSPHSVDGRCARCAGRGVIDLDQKHLVDWPSTCPECGGRRFNAQTLAVRYRGVSAADVLEMTIDGALEFFTNLPRLARPLRQFHDLGLGYLTLGQPATTLSGGEAQRVKLATELWKSDASLATLFVLDEPTSGLHPADVAQLLRALRGLVDAGNTVLVIEHHLDLIAAADWIIDLGPGAGDAGGTIVAEGPPASVIDSPTSLTARALREAFCSDGET